MLGEAERKILFDAAKERGAVFRTLAQVGRFNQAIDQVFVLAAAPESERAAPVAITTTALPPVVEMIDAKLLKIACPENSEAELAAWVAPVRRACARWGIDTFREVASFLANIGVESRGLTRLEENLNYSAKRMAEVWPGRFAINPRAREKDRLPNALAKSLAHKPEQLANLVYANRMGNGPPESGDGWRHRGLGPKMITGARNHAALADGVGIELGEVPAYLQTKEGGMMAAGWFWKENNLDRYAATPGWADDREIINGGAIGLAEVSRRADAIIEELLERERLAA
jgi:putative chitinase